MILIENLSFRYSKELVLDSLDWSLLPGKVHGLVGMNGSGKTTLFKLLSAILKPETGRMTFNGNQINALTCGLMETQPFFYPMITGKEFLTIFKITNPSFNIEAWNNVFKLPLNEVVDNYSTGMQKKLSLMGMVALNRNILIFDEPFNGLDFESVIITRNVLKKLAESGKTIIVSSHIPETITMLCDTLSLIGQGKIKFKVNRDEFDRLEQLAGFNTNENILPAI
ncbi:MAG: ATP-binding cassette domain-containing protein [Lentimicrobium sp.]|nr:ATP-binding cassette domain-containing protein [Lentimicrobium sp.]